MLSADGKKKENADIKKDSDNQEFICPVCGKLLGKNNLPTMNAVIEEGIFYQNETDRIINSHVTIEHEFAHFYDEEKGLTMNPTHKLLSVIKTEFDSAGNCIIFEILEIRSAA